jgi:hypothetical protein
MADHDVTIEESFLDDWVRATCTCGWGYESRHASTTNLAVRLHYQAHVKAPADG